MKQSNGLNTWPVQLTSRKRIQVAAVALANKKSISYCAKNVAGQVQQEGKVGSTRRELDCWSKTLPQTRTIAMEATIFTGWLDFD